jgi:hypothetical protein
MSDYALLWSRNQNAFHIEPVRAMLSNGRAAYLENRACDYIPIATGTLDMMSEIADACRGTLDGRLPRREAA